MKQLRFLFRSSLLCSLCFCFSYTASAQKGTVEGVVKDEQGPLFTATVKVMENVTGTTTDFDGKFSLSLDPGKYTLEVSYVGYATLRQEIEITADQTLNVDFTMSQGIDLDEFVVVGTRGSPRTQLETMAPVDVIGPAAIQSSAQGNVTQVLQYSAPSFHSTPQTISDGTDHIDPAALRGLGPDQTLVLINGKRRHTSSLINVNGTVGRGTVGTDLNAIPASAIERIEILRDGAAAQYGSDAIAGVINVVLKEQTNVLNVNFESGVSMPSLLGTPSTGNAPDSLVPEFASDGEYYQLSTNFGFDVGEKGGFVNVTAEYTDRSSTNRSGNYTGSIYPDNYDNALSRGDFFSQVRSETGFVENQVMEIGNSAVRNGGAFLNAAYPLSDNAELYGNLGFNYRNGIARGFYRFPSSQDRVVPQIWPQGFSPQIHSEIIDNNFTIGTRGKIGLWNVDFSQTRGENEFQFTVKNSNNASLGQSSPTQAYAGGFNYSQNTTNIDFFRGYEFLVPINVAFGGEFRLENYQIFSGEEASYVAGGSENVWLVNGGDTSLVAGAAGIQVFPGFQPQNQLDNSRNSASVYGDFEFDITEALLVGIAARYENYSDFGDAFNWKASARYRILENLSVRAAASTGFRAPSLHQVYFNNLSTQFVTVGGAQVPIQVGTFNNESAVTRAFGIEPLDAETSNNYSAGFTARLLENLSLTVDGYLIEIEDRIVLSGRFSPTEELSGGVLAGNILTPLGAGAAQFFTNAVSTETRGIDVVSAYNKALGEGLLKLTLAANFTETEVKKSNGVPEINTSDLLNGKEDVLFNREEVSRLEVAQPRSKLTFSATYELNEWSFMLRATRFGEIEYIHPSDGDEANWVMNDFTGETETRDQVFDAKIVADVEVSYRFNKHVRWVVGVHNFTNTFPDMHQHSANVSSGRFLYSRRVQQFGVRGLFAYSKLSLTL